MTKINEIKKNVDKWINERPILMDRFDGNYLIDFHHILRENYDIDSLDDERLTPLLDLLGLNKDNSPEELSSKIVEVLDENDYLPKISSLDVKRHHKYVNIPDWEEVKEVKVDGSDDSIEKATKFLAQYSLQSGGNQPKDPKSFAWTNWGRSEEMRRIQTSIIKEYIVNKPDAKMLTLGPRWVAEVEFLRGHFNMSVIGLDLFSSDESFVKIGDMHKMPFDNNTFDIVYEKNTYNKSYDIRKALDETVRVLKPGGMIIYDECMDYTIGVNENARTNIKSHKWTKQYLKDIIDDVIWDREDKDYKNYWINKTGTFIATIKK